MEYLSSFGLISKRLFSAPLCPYSNVVICVTMEPHTSSHLSKYFVRLFRLHPQRRTDYTDDGVLITVLVLTLV